MSDPKPRRTFIAADGKEYPVGPSGYIPESALRRRTFDEKKHPERGPFTKGRKKRRKKYGGVK
jgi:hypothetical protein